jgi:hypothetical protein
VLRPGADGGGGGRMLAGQVRRGHYMTRPLVNFHGGCMVVLKVSCCGIIGIIDGRTRAGQFASVLFPLGHISRGRVCH